MLQPILSIKNALVRSQNKTLFGNLNFSVNKNEHWALIGKSGSGKSVLLQTIAGKFSVSGGEVHNYFFDDFIAQHPPKKDGLTTFHNLISLVEGKHHFKNKSNTTNFYYQQRYNSSDSEDAQTVEEYLHDIVSFTGLQHWQYENVVELLNLSQLTGKELIKLSNGETKRVRLASALLKNPLILLLDNPLTGLDVQTRAEFNGIIGKIIASGINVIMATSPREIPDAITHIAVIDNGEITEVMAKNDFDPVKFASNIQDDIDAAELQELLNNTEAVVYNDIVKINKAHIRYDKNIILDDVSWHIKPGERWALLGANGAGKSTLLSLINGDNPQAYANDIVLFDKKRGTGESIWDIKKRIGFVSPELYQYFPTDNSCLQVIESGYYDTLGLFRPSDAKRSATALRWMKALQIDQYARTLLKNIPASAQRLCLLARALIKNPPLLIFDEPCQGLDEFQQLHFKHLTDTICNLSNVTLIYVSHYQHEIPDSVTRVLKLDKGRVV
ncbi:ATP-binding cassette domain-containing protein [Mucilaginibacter gynuensis]|uniref:ATP-binding cassette domain-containing protein n=1 Tax=Mucilaginibacter gynuensis TaxID=1302236 RepID=A0ABP8FV51_9SPHI